jgi:hypothetical protein
MGDAASCGLLPPSADHENSLVRKQQSQLRSWQLPVLKIGLRQSDCLRSSGLRNNPSIDDPKKLTLFGVRNSLFVAENSLF